MCLPFLAPTDDRRSTTERLLAKERADHHALQVALTVAVQGGEHLHAAIQEAHVRAPRAGSRAARAARHDLGGPRGRPTLPAARRPPTAGLSSAGASGGASKVSRAHTAAVFLLRLAQDVPLTPGGVTEQGQRDQVLVLQDATPNGQAPTPSTR